MLFFDRRAVDLRTLAMVATEQQNTDPLAGEEMSMRPAATPSGRPSTVPEPLPAKEQETASGKGMNAGARNTSIAGFSFASWRELELSFSHTGHPTSGVDIDPRMNYTPLAGERGKRSQSPSSEKSKISENIRSMCTDGIDRNSLFMGCASRLIGKARIGPPADLLNITSGSIVAFPSRRIRASMSTESRRVR
ncbi:hypothetical protein ABZ631_07600 [Nocardiopsis alba]|uniref:hypothetical protein n=2 Tax=Nocardiopsis alba TaxID=53437 RepID=UPI00340B6A37